MPKKSKREKMLADTRRSTFQFVASPILKQSESHEIADTSELTAIKKDLVKTVILATIAIAAELVLYWFERR